MKATIQKTDQIVTVDGVQARVWNGVTEKGIPFTALIYRLGVKREDDAGEFERELQEMPAPKPVNKAFDPRLI